MGLQHSGFRLFAVLIPLVLVFASGCRDEDRDEDPTSEVDVDVSDGSETVPDVSDPATSDVTDGPTEQPTEQPTEEVNACGGQVELRFDGSAAVPGEGCGDCEDGVLVCDGSNALRCLGGTVPNSCGGCALLPFAVGSACGPCGDGVRQCAEGALVCAQATPAQACGGCGDLDGVPGTACTVEGQAGFWQCATRDEVMCDVTGGHVCGLEEAPVPGAGTPCGTCLGGRLACDDGDDALACDAEEELLNACGACGEPPAFVGDACDACGSVWGCGEGSLTCDRAQRNACGGCDALATEPGEPCERGVYACVDGGVVRCVSGASNACGGTVALQAAPGDACGPCGEGVFVCAAPGQVACVGADTRNACGGCLPLQAVPGEPCGRLSEVWVCDGADALDCTIVDEDTDVALEVEPAEVEVSVGESVSASAWAVDAFGVRREVTETVQWSVDDESTATVDDGLITGVAAGVAVVTVTLGALEALVEVRVTDSASPWTDIEITQESAEVLVGGSTALVAQLVNEDGGSLDVTSDAEWTVEDTALASVIDGVVSGLAAGETTVTATWGEFSATIPLTVLESGYVLLRVTAAETEAPLGVGVQLTAVAEDAEGATQTVTSQVTWEVAPETAGTVSASGLFRSLEEGEVTITGRFGDLSDSVTVEVGAAVVLSLAIRPSSFTLQPEGTRTLQAVAIYTDESEEDVTGEALWLSDDAAVATVEDGVVTAVASGETLISAQWNGFEGTSTVLVALTGTPTGLSLAPGGNFSLDRGGCVQFAALAAFESGPPLNVTSGATWTTSSGAMRAEGAPGRFCAREAGPATIQASWEGFNASVVVTGLVVSGVYAAQTDLAAAVHRRLLPDTVAASDFEPASIVHRILLPDNTAASDFAPASIVHRRLFPNVAAAVDPEMHNVERN